MREIILDTETTGLNFKEGDQIIEVGCIELINHVTTGNDLQFYCSSKKTITKEAVKIHGLTNEYLSKYPPFKEQVQKLLDFIKQDTLIIHNADFDIGFINNELSMFGLGPLKNKVIDTVLLARQKLNTRIANLDYLCRRFSIDLSSRKLHGALLDCQLLSEVYLELMGGKQTTLELIESSKQYSNRNNKKPLNTQEISIVKVDESERKSHKEFVKKIKNSIWHKLDY